MKPKIKIKRVYAMPLQTDGLRVLVDRLWPRGLKKEKGYIDEWAKDLAPSTALRKWFGHNPAIWPEFQKRYKSELNKNEAVDHFIEQHKNEKTITLVYAAKDEDHTHALVLQEVLARRYNEL